MEPHGNTEIQYISYVYTSGSSYPQLYQYFLFGTMSICKMISVYFILELSCLKSFQYDFCKLKMSVIITDTSSSNHVVPRLLSIYYVVIYSTVNEDPLMLNYCSILSQNGTITCRIISVNCILGP